MTEYNRLMGLFISRVTSETKFRGATIGMEPCEGDVILPVLRPLGEFSTGIQVPFNKLGDKGFIDSIINSLLTIEHEDAIR